MSNETNETEALSKIAALAPQVAALHVSQSEAIDAERDAEAEVLTHAIELAKPALRALSGRITCHSFETSGRNGCNPVSSEQHFKERGLLLVNGYTSRGDATGNRGAYDGTRLYLLDDGSLFETEREGSYSQWQGEADEWTATGRVITAREAMDEYLLGGLLEAITTALEKQASADRPTARALERAERLRALTTLTK